MGGKIKGSEFIFALIATELRNCLTSKIAPAQANYIHLLSLLVPVPPLHPPPLFKRGCPFYPSRSCLSSSVSLYVFRRPPLRASSIVRSLPADATRRRPVSSCTPMAYPVDITSSFYYSVLNNGAIRFYDNTRVHWDTCVCVRICRENFQRH